MIVLRRGDVTAAETEAVVREVVSDGTSPTAAARRMEARLGEKVLARLEQMGETPIGTAILTPGGELHASFVLHVTLSSYEEPVTPKSVEKGVRNGLRRASDFGIESLALPPLGLGAGNLDPEGTAGLLVQLLTEHLAGDEQPRRFEIVVETEYQEEVFQRVMHGPPSDPTE